MSARVGSPKIGIRWSNSHACSICGDRVRLAPDSQDVVVVDLRWRGHDPEPRLGCLRHEPSSSPRFDLGLIYNPESGTVFRFENTERCSVSQAGDGGAWPVADSGSEAPAPRKRSDARRNEETLLAAAAAAFVASGVDVPVRDIAARAGVGVGTIYRHFPTRADLIVSGLPPPGRGMRAGRSDPSRRQQLAPCRTGEVGRSLHRLPRSPNTASPAPCSRDSAAFETLHAYFLDRLVPVCAELLDAAAAAGEIVPDVDAYGLMRGIGNLCIGADADPELRPTPHGATRHRRPTPQ